MSYGVEKTGKICILFVDFQNIPAIMTEMEINYIILEGHYGR
jgi:hypothetical protein